MQLLSITLLTGFAAAQTLNIPTRSGYQALSAASVIPAGQSRDYANKEFDRGVSCGDGENGSADAVFVLEDGASISNVIIGSQQREGIHCKGRCTITNAWFRDVCEDAISVLGSGDATIRGGGAQNADDKVVQHNGRGTVTISDYTVVNVGKLYRSCGDCTSNQSNSPRNVVISNIKANGVSSDLVGINSNFGDTANISGSCGKSKRVCQEYKGVNKGSGSSSKASTTANCRGAQGLLAGLPAC